MPPKIYTSQDANLEILKNKTCAIIGFGSQGRAQALNFKESGVDVLMGLRVKSKNRNIAKKLGLQVTSVSQAVKKADVICLAIPDLKIPEIFETEILPHLTPGKSLIFLHGFAIHYKTIQVPSEIDVILVAPKGGPGPSVRRQFIEGKGVPAVFAIHQDPSKNAKKIALAWAKGIGSTRIGVWETTFQEETEVDLFGEQAILCGGVTSLLHAGFETLIEAGYQPEMAYVETLHELKLTVDLIYQSGIAGMRRSISEIASYGDVTVGPQVINASVKKQMKAVLKKIQSGKFAKECIKQSAEGGSKHEMLLQQGEEHPIEEPGRRIRKLMGGL